jgi:hypothetical protein
VKKLLALTLHRPWSVLITKGLKDLENRSWSPEPLLRPGEWFAIHAGQKYDLACQMMAQRLGLDLGVFFDEPPSNRPGHIVAVAQYGGFVRETTNPWFFGPPHVGWLLPQVVEVEPIPCRGAQKLWYVPEEIAERVRAAFRRARSAASHVGCRYPCPCACHGAGPACSMCAPAAAAAGAT